MPVDIGRFLRDAATGRKASSPPTRHEACRPRPTAAQRIHDRMTGTGMVVQNAAIPAGTSTEPPP
ncbi:hypothetical protein HL658_13390 [Azospirillum sp. RWY-5-1]|uniref:Uncharacterized protein n=1 Tax=Azospirillum oleiclasticum TaxID=2735135 RepID=A0ABX2TC15_9PROT|nr:hypothetical protein [Azospirillum oleiclasticum]NYZ13547.1 hypothetical protein [Azospirillum oleiclasticum]NYZ20708.1 hypothetical protein [Azospirillum oleiclasticum]